MRTRWLLWLFLGTLACCANAQAQNDLKKNLKDTNVAEHWIYDDIAAGFTEARETGKPLLVTFRCVP
jgi:hypothetical protein